MPSRLPRREVWQHPTSQPEKDLACASLQLFDFFAIVEHMVSRSSRRGRANDSAGADPYRDQNAYGVPIAREAQRQQGRRSALLEGSVYAARSTMQQKVIVPSHSRPSLTPSCRVAGGTILMRYSGPPRGMRGVKLAKKALHPLWEGVGSRSYLNIRLRQKPTSTPPSCTRSALSLEPPLARLKHSPALVTLFQEQFKRATPQGGFAPGIIAILVSFFHGIAQHRVQRRVRHSREPLYLLSWPWIVRLPRKSQSIWALRLGLQWPYSGVYEFTFDAVPGCAYSPAHLGEFLLLSGRFAGVACLGFLLSVPLLKEGDLAWISLQHNLGWHLVSSPAVLALLVSAWVGCSEISHELSAGCRHSKLTALTRGGVRYPSPKIGWQRRDPARLPLATKDPAACKDAAHAGPSRFTIGSKVPANDMSRRLDVGCVILLSQFRHRRRSGPDIQNSLIYTYSSLHADRRRIAPALGV